MRVLTGKRINRILLLILLLTGGGSSYSQAVSMEKDTSAFRSFVDKVQQAYAHASHLEFKLSYYYANADRPGLYVDSLKGEMQMDKGHSRMSIDGMETILTDKYAIQVLNEDKAIYLAAPRQASAANPVGMLDSIFAHVDGVRTSIRRREQQEVMTLMFPPGQAYSSLEIQVNAKTGFFQRIIYSLNTSSLVGQEMINRPDNPTPYQSRGRMEIVFTGYRQGQFDDRVFQPENFINKIAPGRFEPAGPYRDYHIYLASSNL
jgi:hypothetical protein